ncbi:MAG: ATP-binding protein [Rhodospirillales bacterium]|nr:ATP-binding protein [Rhodospirillales bacterium]
MRLNRLLGSSVFRLALVYLFLFSASVMALVGFVYWSTQASLTRQIDATIDAEITGLAEQFNQRGILGLMRAIQRRADAGRHTRGIYILTDSNFAPLAGNLSAWPDVEPEADGWITFPLDYAEQWGGGINYARGRVFDLGGWYHLLVGHDVRERLLIAGRIRETVLLGIAAVIGLTLLAGLLMSRRLLRQVDAINRTSQEIIAGDLSRRIPITGRGDEFDKLAGNLNAMLDQIERLLTGMKEVSDNIAHDLRSPLARMRSRLEVTLMEQPDSAAYREAISRTIDEADALLKTFNALLSIAQAEAGASRRHFEALELGALLGDVSELYEPLAEERGQRLVVGLDGEARIRGDRDLLFQAIANLVDNAIKFAPDNGTVELSLAQANGRAEIIVADDGPGIPEVSRAKVLERFYRLETSRSTPGSGLGLSLVAAVAELHDGRLVLADNAPGLKASLALPFGAAAKTPAKPSAPPAEAA